MSDWKDSSMTHTELFDALDERDKRIKKLEAAILLLAEQVVAEQVVAEQVVAEDECPEIAWGYDDGLHWKSISEKLEREKERLRQIQWIQIPGRE